jgi:hypothetical protein
MNFYVTWVIYNTQGFFLDMYLAIQGSDQVVHDGLAAVVTLLNPPESQKQAEAVDLVLAIIGFGTSLYAEGSIVTKALLRTLPQTAALLPKIMPAGTVDASWQTWSELT